ncbi:MAG: cyclopropane-fatty-acyl-phospholipid synthase family protein, partial [Actinomycetota bacterium]|nr:cyclopropane-fatty-acyl-phospholipid synthase family protein [Actinomycetota bacterium]
TGVSMPLRLWDGTTLGSDDEGFRIVLRHPWSLRAMLLPPSDLSAGEAYLDDDIDLEGDAVGLMEVGARMQRAGLTRVDQARLARQLLRLPRPPRRSHPLRARLRGARHSRARDRAAIAHHYDLDQRFYEQFLDRRLVYSCAYFGTPDEDLETAQLRKLDVVCRKLRLRPGRRLLDIGCGWGSLLLHAAREYGVVGVGATLSRTQAEAGRQRAEEAGLGDRVDIRLMDYRDLTGTFDAVASIGMFEHVGVDHLGEYFRAAHRLTAPGGLFLNHGIVTGHNQGNQALHGRSFAAKYVFPDGALAPAWRAAREMEEAGFELIDVEQLRPHYELTLRHWVRRLERNHEAAVAAASEVRYRVWRSYMAASALGFARGDMGLAQVLGSKGHDLPLGRSWMLPAF